MLRGGDVGAPQVRDQQLVAAKDVKRQEAMAVVVAMEEPPLLLPMHRRVRRVKVQDQVRRRLAVRSNESLHQLRVYRPRRRPRLAVLEPAECPHARQFVAVGRELMHRIEPQMLRVVQVLPASFSVNFFASRSSSLLFATLLVSAPRIPRDAIFTHNSANWRRQAAGSATIPPQILAACADPSEVKPRAKAPTAKRKLQGQPQYDPATLRHLSHSIPLRSMQVL